MIPIEARPLDPILYLTHRAPHPPDKGDRIRNFHLLRNLSQHGRVWLGCLADEPVAPASLSALKAFCERVSIVPVQRFSRWLKAALSVARGRSLSEGLFSNAEMKRTIRQWTGETRFRAAVVSASSLVPYLRDEGLRQTPAIIDLVDVDSRKWLDFSRASSPPRRWLYSLEATRVRKLEAELPGWARAISVVSRAEADVYEAFAGNGTATVATNGVDLDYFRPSTAAWEQSCVFVGAMDYLPNVDGAVWFAREVWPAVRKRFPAAEFRIVGRKPDARVTALAAAPGVSVTGTVPDVRPLLDSAGIAVVPLRLARGVQNKVLEALAMGKAAVASPAALAALEVQPGKHLLQAESPSEWVEAISGLFNDPEQCRVLGRAGRQFVEEHHQWQRCLSPLIEKVVAQGARTR